MPKIDVVKSEAKVVGLVNMSDEVFGVQVNYALIHQVIKAQLAGRRQGNAKTKCKGEVRGGGRKPFKQKGTGNARQGSRRSPLMPGGGQSFGPIPRSYAQRTPKEMVRGAVRSALSERLKSKRLVIIDKLALKEAKTQVAAKLLKGSLKLEKALLIDSENKGLELATRNLNGFRTLPSSAINVYDIIKYPWLVLTQQAVTELETRFKHEGKSHASV